MTAAKNCSYMGLLWMWRKSLQCCTSRSLSLSVTLSANRHANILLVTRMSAQSSVPLGKIFISWGEMLVWTKVIDWLTEIVSLMSATVKIVKTMFLGENVHWKQNMLKVNHTNIHQKSIERSIQGRVIVSLHNLHRGCWTLLLLLSGKQRINTEKGRDVSYVHQFLIEITFALWSFDFFGKIPLCWI